MARVTINNWISNKTQNRIQDTLPLGVVDTNTVLVLVNTIYFKVSEHLKQQLKEIMSSLGFNPVHSSTERHKVNFLMFSLKLLISPNFSHYL